MTTSDRNIEEAQLLDREDALSGYRDRFTLPPGRDGKPAVYFAGNSLGLQPSAVRESIEAVLDDWSALAVRGWTGASPPWTQVDRPLSAFMVPILGALESEVSVSGTLTGNLHAMLTSFYRPTPTRYRVLMEHRPFPSDRYAVQSHARWHGMDPGRAVLEATPTEAGGLVDDDALIDLISRERDSIALVLIGAVNYYSGQAFDIGRICRTARDAGCVVGLDLAHAAGNTLLQLHDHGPDFAVWCGYKYLNGGPGAPAGLFVHQRHHGRFDGPRLAGWWGHRLDTRFRMPDAFEPESGATGWQISTPSVIALAPLAASLGIFREVGLDRLREKSIRLTGYLDRLLRDRLAGQVDIVSPSDPDRRGAQLSLRVRSRAREVFEHLQRADVVCDWREPDAIRVAPAPLYNSFRDVADFVHRLEQAVGH